jgi:hypothetical protein
MLQYDNRGSFHYTPRKHPRHPRQNTCLSSGDRDLRVAKWDPQFLTGDTVGKFLIVFRLILYNGEYIFAVTSFAPDDVCTRMTARIRIFQTTDDRKQHIGRDASAMYHQTKLLPTLEWKGHVVPANLTDLELYDDPRLLNITTSTLHRLGDQNPGGNRLCEVLVNITFSDPLINQQDYCVIEDITATGVAAAAAAASPVSVSRNKNPMQNSGASSSSSSSSSVAAAASAASASERIPGAAARTAVSISGLERGEDLVRPESYTTGTGESVNFCSCSRALSDRTEGQGQAGLILVWILVILMMLLIVMGCSSA